LAAIDSSSVTTEGKPSGTNATNTETAKVTVAGGLSLVNSGDADHKEDDGENDGDARDYNNKVTSDFRQLCLKSKYWAKRTFQRQEGFHFHFHYQLSLRFVR
jgi:hypothetical protein